MEVFFFFFPCVYKLEVVKKTTNEFELIVEVIVIYCPFVPNIPRPRGSEA
jgi:hypothetical protein